MLTCREITESADDYLDGALGLRATIEVRLHLMMCKYCRAFVRQMRVVGRVVRDFGSALPPQDTEDELLAAYRRSRAGAGDAPS